VSLPNKFKIARMTDDTFVVNVDDNVGLLEAAICDALGFSIDTDITESPTNFDNAGRFTKALLRQKAAGPVGWRFKDTGGKEMRIVVNGTNFDIDENTATEDTPTWVNRWRLPVVSGAGAGLKYAATDATQIVNPTSATSFNKSYTLPANSLVAGSMLRVKMTGLVTIAAGAGSTFRVSARLGTGANRVWSMITASLAADTYYWQAEGHLVVKTAGAGGVYKNSGVMHLSSATGVIAASCAVASINGNVDTTAAQLIDSFVTLATGDAANTVDLYSFTVELLQPESVA